MTILRLLLFTFLLSSAHAQIPTSPRSKKAVADVKPRLESQLKEKGLLYGSRLFIRIFKESEELEIWCQNDKTFNLFKVYEVCDYGSRGLGPKTEEGDGQAPEGFYKVYPRSLNPLSSFHLSFNLGYPNDYDRSLGRTGGALMVHGSCASLGCFAMTDSCIEEIYALVEAALRNGQDHVPVHIFPFRMTDENMTRHRTSVWLTFWENLQEGYQFFEETNLPPRVYVKQNRYCFK